MQPWQIKVLEWEASALKDLDTFMADHALYVLIGLIYLVITLGIGLILLLRKSLKGKGHVQPVVFIGLPGPPPPPQDTFDPFPPPHHSAHCDCDDDWE
jgi:hypothetical protein